MRYEYKKIILGSKDPGTKSGRKIPFGCSLWRAIAKPTLKGIGSDLFFKSKNLFAEGFVNDRK